jgi:hypothetical protein
MHRGLLLIPFIAVAALAEAQPTGTRGFVNQHLMRANVFDKGLKVTVSPPAGKPLPDVAPASRPTTCAIPLLEVQVAKEVDTRIILPHDSFRADEKMILPSIPTCPAK